MKFFTRWRKVFVCVLIVFVTFPVLARGGHLVRFPLPTFKPFSSIEKTTQLNIPITSSTQPTTSSQQNTSTMSNPLKQNRACYPVSRWTEMNQKASERYERGNRGIIFPSTVNAEKKVSPMVRRFVRLFELYSIEDQCELSVLMDHHDFQGVKIYPMSMNKFHVYFEGERFLLRKMPILRNIPMNNVNQTPDLNLAQRIIKAYPNAVFYVVISFTMNKESVRFYSEWILTK